MLPLSSCCDSFSPFSILCLLFAQGRAESGHHLPGASEADPGCHPVPPGPGYPNARPRRAGLTTEGDGESDAAAAAHTHTHTRRCVQTDDVTEKRGEREGRNEQIFLLAALLQPLPRSPRTSLLPRFLWLPPPLELSFPSCRDGGKQQRSQVTLYLL